MEMKCPKCGGELTRDDFYIGYCLNCKNLFAQDFIQEYREKMKREKQEELLKAKNARDKEQREWEELERKGRDKQYDGKPTIQEYKRTCNECEKVWHSLVSREEEIEGQFKNYEKASWCFCCGGNSESLTQSVRNRDAAKENLDKLKKCPDCLSSNYKEEVISHEKK